MPTTTPTRTPSFASIDDYLGPAEGRFFGSGYRRVGYRLQDLERGGLDTAGIDPDLLARLAIDYPGDWSTKATATALKPHLSTVDALVLGARIGALALAGLPDLDAASRRRAWLRRVDIRAGAKPVEEGLDALTVTATRAATTLTLDGPEDALTTVDTRVGSMKVRCEFAHPLTPGGAEAPSLTDLAAETARGTYGDAFATQRQTISDVRLDLAGSRAEAVVAVHPLDTGDRPAAAPLVSMVDAFVVSLQLGQVLLYELDGVERGRSNNLWMRSTTLSADAPYRPAVEPFPVAARLADARLLPRAGATWRTAVVVGDVLGVQTRCAVAHELPDAATSRLAA
jgi:hypothetical protein